MIIMVMAMSETLSEALVPLVLTHKIYGFMNDQLDHLLVNRFVV